MKKRVALYLCLATVLIFSTLLFTSCKKTFTVSFDSDGGSAVESISVEEGLVATAPEAPVKDGYTFLGWYINNDKWDFANYIIYSDITLKARWTKNYTVTFDSDGGTGTASQTLISGEKIAVPSVPTKDGYTFLGWYSGDFLWDFETDTVNADITLKAKWKAIYTVSFDADGGSNVKSQAVNDGGKITLPTAPTKDKYVFDGWYLGDAKWDFESGTVTENITLKAKWLPIFTVKFDSDGGGNVPNQSVVSGNLATPPAQISKTDYVFDGWYLGDDKWDFASDKVSANITLTAKWKKIHKVSFNTDGGSQIPLVTVIDGGLIEKPSDPTKELYLFGAWYYGSEPWDFENDTVTSDITLSATWNANYYTVSFDTKGAGEIPDIMVVKGGKITAPTSPAKPDHAFVAWTIGGMRWNFNAPVETSMTLVAEWDPNFFVIEFKDGETLLSTVRIPKSEPIVPVSEAPTKDEHRFIGWANGADAWNFSNPATSDLILTAVWQREYTVKFDSDGGTPVSDQTLAEGGKLSIPGTPIRDGYRLDGWYLGDTKWDFGSTVNSNMELKAKWIRVFTVTLDPIGGTVADGDLNITVDSGTPISSLPVAQKNDFKFDGWYLDNNAWDINAPVTEDITLTAKWIPYYTVSFDTNGGSGIFADQKILGDGNSKATVPSLIPAKTHYVFAGWYLRGDVGSEDTPWDFEAMSVASSITLIAKWTPVKYTVTFNPNSGTNSESSSAGYPAIEVSYGSTIDIDIADPTRGEYYSFNGWHDENGNLWDFENDVVEGDMTLTAHWIQHSVGGGNQGALGPWDEKDGTMGPIDDF